MTTSVIVSGATGYIAQHIIKLLLEKEYNVIGTVRSDAKGNNLKTLFNSEAFHYEVVEDLTTPNAFDEVLKKHTEATVFLHTASPATHSGNDIAKEILEPAIEGTKSVFSAITKYAPQVKHVVFTSSVAAMFDLKRERDPSHIITEDSWGPVTIEETLTNGRLGYMASKKYAEMFAWDYMSREQPSFSFNVICPVSVFGPQAFDSEVKDTLNVSAERVNVLLKLTPHAPVPSTDLWFVDVRDVAEAHLIAFERELKNQRLLLSTEKFTSQGLLDIIHAKFPQVKDRIPVGVPGAGEKVKLFQVNNEKTREVLGLPLIDLETSVEDTVSQIMRRSVRFGNLEGWK